MRTSAASRVSRKSVARMLLTFISAAPRAPIPAASAAAAERTATQPSAMVSGGVWLTDLGRDLQPGLGGGEDEGSKDGAELGSGHSVVRALGGDGGEMVHEGEDDALAGSGNAVDDAEHEASVALGVVGQTDFGALREHLEDAGRNGRLGQLAEEVAEDGGENVGVRLGVGADVGALRTSLPDGSAAPSSSPRPHRGDRDPGCPDRGVRSRPMSRLRARGTSRPLFSRWMIVSSSRPNRAPLRSATLRRKTTERGRKLIRSSSCPRGSRVSAKRRSPLSRSMTKASMRLERSTVAEFVSELWMPAVDVDVHLASVEDLHLEGLVPGEAIGPSGDASPSSVLTVHFQNAVDLFCQILPTLWHFQPPPLSREGLSILH